MRISNIILSKMNAGQLQNLSVDLLPRLHKDWGSISHNGAVEGTDQTRKGTPDAFCVREDGSYVFIQATCNRNSKKITEDLEKSLQVIKGLSLKSRHLCITFLSFDPPLNVIEDCRLLCKHSDCDFEYYTNSSISLLLNKYPDLHHKYIGRAEMYNQDSITDVKDERLQLQSFLTLNSWKENSKNYVYTEVFDKALKSLEQNKIIILMGEGMSGKTSTAYALCNNLIERYDLKPNIIDLNKFEEYYDPSDCRKIYCFDDVFGATSIDDSQVNSATKKLFLKLLDATKLGAFVILTSRKYIFNEVVDKNRLKESVSEFFVGNIITEINYYKKNEKELILYNYIKYGNLPKEKKSQLKPFLKTLANHPNFMPELARRLGNDFFHQNFTVTQESIINFFENPNDYLREIFRQLSDKYQAAVLFILLNNGELSHPVRQLDDRITLHYDITTAQLNKILNYMKGSMVELKPTSNGFFWCIIHPTIHEALLPLFKDRIDLYLEMADFKILSNETICCESEEADLFFENLNFNKSDTESSPINAKPVYIIPSYWVQFCARFFNSYREAWINSDSWLDYSSIRVSDLAIYFATKTSPKFLLWFNEQVSDDVWVSLTLNRVSSLHSTPAYVLASRLIKLNILKEELRIKIAQQIKDIAMECFDISFLNEDIRTILSESDFVFLLNHYSKQGSQMALNQIDDEFYSDFDNYYSSEKAIIGFHKLWLQSIENLTTQIELHGFWSSEKKEMFDETIKIAEDLVLSQIEQMNDNLEFECEIIEDVIHDLIKEIKGEDDRDVIHSYISKTISKIQEEFYIDEDESWSKIIKCIPKETLSFLHDKLLTDVEDIFRDVDA